MIEPGSPAPDFTLPDQDGNRVSLSDYRGRTVVLVFYPADFSPVCTDQLSVYQEVLPELESRGVKLYGVSVDNAFCHAAFQKDQGITIPLLADFHPKGEIAQAYSVWREPDGFSERALYVVDPDGVIAHSQVTPFVHHVPDIYELFDALDELVVVR